MTGVRNSVRDEHTIAIIAGNGSLPTELADELTRLGRSVFILGIEGEADPGIGKYTHDLGSGFPDV